MDNSQEIMSRLKFIGKIKKGDKINTIHVYVQPSGLQSILSRSFLNKDNRENALNFVKETVGRGFELLTTYKRSSKESDKILANHLIDDLTMSKTGLENLKSTYFDDTKFCCDMDTLLQQITANLLPYNNVKQKDEINDIAKTKEKVQ